MDINDTNKDMNSDTEYKLSVMGISEISPTRFNPQKIGGLRPNEGDTHGDQILPPQ